MSSKPTYCVRKTNGFLIKQDGQDITRFGTSSNDRRIHVHEDIMMNKHYIANLKDPSSALDAANKNYVDNAVAAVAATVTAVASTAKKNLVGYIPQLETNESRTGFVAKASTSATNI